MLQKSPASRPVEAEELTLLWGVAVRVLLILGGVNFLVALVAWLAGPSIHPLLSGTDAWLMFAVTAVGMVGNAMLLLLMRHFLCAPVPASALQAARPCGFLRLPLSAALSPCRRCARLRSCGRPVPRAPHGLRFGRPQGADENVSAVARHIPRC